MAVCLSSVPHAVPTASNTSLLAPRVPPTGSSGNGKRLALVEMRLVMQMLDMQSVLRGARCSRFHMMCAASPFVWKHMAPLTLRHSALTSDEEIATIAACLEHSQLLRFAQVQVQWVGEGAGFTSPLALIQRPPSDAEVSRVLSLPRLVSIDLRGRDGVPLRTLLSHSPLVDSLQKLKIGALNRPSPIDAASVALLPSLRHVHTLWVHKGLALQSSDDFFNALAAMPSLTNLCIMCCFGLPCMLAELRRCTQLRRLHLRSLHPHVFEQLFASPSLHRLQHLTLELLHIGSLGTADSYVRVFGHMHSLRRLMLSGFTDLTELLPSLAHCAQLAELVLEAGSSVEDTPPCRLALRPFLRAVQPLRQLVLQREQEGELTTTAADDAGVPPPRRTSSSLTVFVVLPTLAEYEQRHSRRWKFTQREERSWHAVVDEFGRVPNTSVLHALPEAFVF
jgi:hypothetical protein